MEKRNIEIINGLTPASVIEVTNNLTSLVLEGEVPALQMQCLLAATEKACKSVKGAIAEAVLNEAEDNGEKTFNAYGCKVTIKETGVDYDYTGSSEWMELQNQIDNLRNKQKELESILSPFANTGKAYVDDKTGEAVYVHKASKTGVSITLPK